MSNILLTPQIVLHFFAFFHQMKLFLLLYAWFRCQVCCLLLTYTCLAVLIPTTVLSQQLSHVICLPSELIFCTYTAICGNLMNRYRNVHWCIVSSGSWLICSICLLLSLALYCFWVMPFVFCETAVNTKSKVPLFHLIHLFADFYQIPGIVYFYWAGDPLSFSHWPQSLACLYL